MRHFFWGMAVFLWIITPVFAAEDCAMDAPKMLTMEPGASAAA